MCNTFIGTTIILAATAFFFGPSTAAENTLETCAAVQPDTSRLACFDALALSAVAAVPIQTPIKSDWVTSVRTSPIDDSKNVFMHVTGSDGIRNQYGQERSVILTLACRENVTSAYVSFGGYFMSDLNGAGRVTYRVDSTPAQTKSFGESNDHEALGLWSGGTAIPWIKSLFGGTRMYLEATPYNDNTVKDFFPIVGLEAEIVPLREACGW